MSYNSSEKKIANGYEKIVLINVVEKRELYIC